MSRLEEAIAAGRFIVTAELLTVNSGGLDAVRHHFEPFEDWVDAVNATDNTAAHAHASPLAVAIALKQLGMEPVMQLVCRDRNRLALQAEIAGAALHGIENICCLTGDDVTAGDEPEARRVFDLDSIQLLAVAESMRNGRYLSGRKLDPPPHLFLGAVENPQAPPLHHRVDRALKKVRAGARFLQLQVVFELAPLERSWPKRWQKGLAERAAILPVHLPRPLAERAALHRRARPGDQRPRGRDRALRARADPEAECFEVACELADAARSLPGVRGLHLISFRKEAGIARLCSRLGIPTRHERETIGNGSRVAV